jgi:putative flavoprotein involved in K+ transport
VKRAATVIVGAGQAGLAMSKELTDRSIDHVLIERGEVANSWRKERWDSLRLLTPNWLSRLPGYNYTGDDPDGFMDMRQVVKYLQDYSNFIRAPVETGTTITSIRQADRGFVVETDRGRWSCRAVVLASGACNIASVPKVGQELSSTITCLTPMQYRNPEQLGSGNVLVVGASATGIQLAKEIQLSGRQVVLSVGEHVRVPRVYRGRDIKWWMDTVGLLDERYDEVDDIKRARRVASLQLVGTPERETLDLNALTAIGVEIVGRLMGVQESRAIFSGSLTNQCALADLKMNRLLDTIDEWVEVNEMAPHIEERQRFEPTRVNSEPPLHMDLRARGIKSVVWATGYRPDYSWLNVPVFDRKGHVRHDGGIVEVPGMYLMGMPFLRRRKSSLIDGAGADARDLAEHLSTRLRQAAA